MHKCEEIKTNHNLTFDALKYANFNRKSEAVFPSHNWTLEQWACAMGGECGEALNEIKKFFRGDYQGKPDGYFKEKLSNELADIIIYADLLAQKAGIDLGVAVIDKFNAVSVKKGSKTRL